MTTTWREDLSAPIISIFGFVLLGLLQSCSTPSTTPEHLELVLPYNEDPSTITGDHRTEIEAWLRTALYRPRSTFRVWKPGENRTMSHLITESTVPDRWGSNPLGAKAAFKRRCLAFRESFLEPHPELHPKTLPEDSAEHSTENHPAEPIPPLVPGHTTLICPSLRLDSSAYRKANAVILDLSGNADVDIARHFLKDRYRHWLRETGAAEGSTFLVLVTGRNRQATHILFRLTIPEGSPGYRLTYALGAEHELSRLTLPIEENSSACIEALHLADALLTEAGIAEHEIAMLSDLREINTRYAFEHSIPNTNDFHTWLKTHQLWMDLRRTRIRIAGLSHTSHHAQFDGAEDTALRTLWHHTLQAMGCTDLQIVTSPETLTGGGR